MNVLVIDYGMGNLGSVRRAIEECGAAVQISGNPDDLNSATHVILPGVGSFADGSARLRERGWRDALHRAIDRGLPLLGICLGMQLLADIGEEGGENPGLGLIPGEVRRLVPDHPDVRIPHVGWNDVHYVSSIASEKLFMGIPDGTDFYFVHSFAFRPSDPAAHLLATTPYCGGFASVVGRGAVFGTQFHPEKSQPVGFQLLRNFLSQ
ncbi:MAG: imidazole glycerol phosphate synthase subunit HisH [Candidatus Riflebacteria bacterium]|nr:imidazole glycerol phosphate synthase subunit HisH [Candidatus Riflebacteria bacterium]